MPSRFQISWTRTNPSLCTRRAHAWLISRLGIPPDHRFKTELPRSRSPSIEPRPRQKVSNLPVDIRETAAEPKRNPSHCRARTSISRRDELGGVVFNLYRNQGSVKRWLCFVGSHDPSGGFVIALSGPGIIRCRDSHAWYHAWGPEVNRVGQRAICQGPRETGSLIVYCTKALLFSSREQSLRGAPRSQCVRNCVRSTSFVSIVCLLSRFGMSLPQTRLGHPSE